MKNAEIVGTKLYSEIEKNLDANSPNKHLEKTKKYMSAYFSNRLTKSQRLTTLDAPMNKIKVLASLNHWWKPSATSWDTILKNNQSVIINLGTVQNSTYKINTSEEFQKSLQE
jgi:hypothetical protein